MARTCNLWEPGWRLWRAWGGLSLQGLGTGPALKRSDAGREEKRRGGAAARGPSSLGPWGEGPGAPRSGRGGGHGSLTTVFLRSIVCVGGDGMFSEVLHGLVGRTQRDAGVDQNHPRAALVPSPLRIGIIPAGTEAGPAGSGASADSGRAAPGLSLQGPDFVRVLASPRLSQGPLSQGSSPVKGPRPLLPVEGALSPSPGGAENPAAGEVALWWWAGAGALSCHRAPRAQSGRRGAGVSGSRAWCLERGLWG